MYDKWKDTKPGEPPHFINEYDDLKLPSLPESWKVYHEETTIDEILHWRGEPDGEWVQFSFKELTIKLLETRDALDKAYAELSATDPKRHEYFWPGTGPDKCTGFCFKERTGKCEHREK